MFSRNFLLIVFAAIAAASLAACDGEKPTRVAGDNLANGSNSAFEDVNKDVEALKLLAGDKGPKVAYQCDLNNLLRNSSAATADDRPGSVPKLGIRHLGGSSYKVEVMASTPQIAAALIRASGGMGAWNPITCGLPGAEPTYTPRP